MARKRSLKDAAADQLVGKNKTVSEASLSPTPKRAAGRRPAKTPVKVIEPEPTYEPPPVSDDRPVLPEPSKATVERKDPPGSPPLLWAAVALLIGCVGGYFFGVGQAIGPANMAFLLVGFAGGYLCGRFLKIF
jgi:hypothetical protein